jgi:hypothetical protein
MASGRVYRGAPYGRPKFFLFSAPAREQVISGKKDATAGLAEQGAVDEYRSVGQGNVIPSRSKALSTAAIS